MQIGHDKRVGGRPIDRARHIANQLGAIYTKLCTLFCHLPRHLSVTYQPAGLHNEPRIARRRFAQKVVIGSPAYWFLAHFH